MKKLLYVLTSLLILVASSFGAASYTSVTATLTDSSLQNWTGATVIATLRPTPYNPGTPLNNGLAITDSPQTTITDGTGTFTFAALDDVTHITPAGALWTFCIYPNATVVNGNCINVAVSGSSMNLTGLLSSILTVPNVVGLPVVNRAYNQNEVTSGNGGLYWDVTANVLKGCNLVGGVCTWTTIGNIGVPGNINYIPFNNGAGGFTASASLQFNPNTNIFTTVSEVVTSIQQTNSITNNISAFLPVGGTAPTCSNFTGGGTGSSCAVDLGSTNSLGRILLTAGSASTASFGGFRLNFGTPALPVYTGRYPCVATISGGSWVSPYGLAAQTGTSTFEDFAWFNGSNLNTGQVYSVNYVCWSM